MGRRAKKARSDERRKQKRLRKEAARAQWAAWTSSGDNQKRKRSKLGARKIYHRGSHPQGPCGNIGCIRCFPNLDRRC
jgi:hypothetical protein